MSNTNDANLLASVALVYLKLGNYFKAISVLHDALALAPSDPVATDLLKRALESNKNNSSKFFDSVGTKINTLNNKGIRSLVNHASGSPTNPRLISSTSDKNQDVDKLAHDLKMGENSSDEDEQVMDIESD